jgi:hypothetical protein
MTIDEFVREKVMPQHRGIVKTLRQLMRRHAPGSTELITYGILGFRGERMLAVINPTRKGITFAFSRGASFEDKYGLLEGVGKVSKNVRMSELEDVNKTALRYYIKQAVKLDPRR